MARRKKRSSGSKSLFRLGSMRISKSDIFETLGAGAGGAIGGIVNSFRPPEKRFSGNIAQGIGGIALAFFGGKRGAQIGKGVLMKTAGDFIEDFITKQEFFKPNSQTSTNSVSSTEDSNMIG